MLYMFNLVGVVIVSLLLVQLGFHFFIILVVAAHDLTKQIMTSLRDCPKLTGHEPQCHDIASVLKAEGQELPVHCHGEALDPHVGREHTQNRGILEVPDRYVAGVHHSSFAIIDDSDLTVDAEIECRVALDSADAVSAARRFPDA